MQLFVDLADPDVRRVDPVQRRELLLDDLSRLLSLLEQIHYLYQ